MRRYEPNDLPLSVIDVMSDFAGDSLPLKVIELQNETVDELLNLLRPMCTGVDDTVMKLKKFQRDTNTTFIVISSFNRTNYSQAVSYESFKERQLRVLLQIFRRQ